MDDVAATFLMVVHPDAFADFMRASLSGGCGEQAGGRGDRTERDGDFLDHERLPFLECELRM